LTRLLIEEDAGLSPPETRGHCTKCSAGALSRVSFGQKSYLVCLPTPRRRGAAGHLQLAPENLVTTPTAIATVEFIERELQLCCPFLAFDPAKLAFASFELEQLGIDFDHKAVSCRIRNAPHHEWSPKQFVTDNDANLSGRFA
jgi:hypothetical protein